MYVCSLINRVTRSKYGYFHKTRLFMNDDDDDDDVCMYDMLAG